MTNAVRPYTGLLSRITVPVKTLTFRGVLLATAWQSTPRRGKLTILAGGTGQVGGMGVKQVTVIAALAAAMALASCAVGPDFATPTAPETERYTPEPLRSTTSSAPVADGAAQRFLKGRDVSGEWWRLYGSRPLNTLIRRALDANPNLQAAMSTLRIANENVYAQQGKFFPLIQGNFNPTRQQQTSAITPIPSAVPPPNPFNLVTSQLTIA